MQRKALHRKALLLPAKHILVAPKHFLRAILDVMICGDLRTALEYKRRS